MHMKQLQIDYLAKFDFEQKGKTIYERNAFQDIHLDLAIYDLLVIDPL